MDTKLKRYSPLLKTCAFLLATFLSALIVVYSINMCNTHFISWDYNLDDLLSDSVENTNRINWNRQHASSAANTFSVHKSVAQIEKTDIPQDIIDQEKESLFTMYYNQIYNELIYNQINPEYTEYELRKIMWDYFLEKHAEEIVGIPERIKERYKSELKSSEDTLSYYSEWNYFIFYPEDNSFLTNTQAVSLEGFNQMYKYFGQEINPTYSYGETYAVALSESYLSEQREKYNNIRDILTVFIIKMLLLILFWLTAVIYLIFAAGRKDDGKKIYMTAFDKLFTELILVLWCGAAAAIAYCSIAVFFRFINYHLCLFFFCVSLLLFLAIGLSLVRHIKNRSIFKRTMIFMFFKFLFVSIRKMFVKLFSFAKPMTRFISAMCALGLLTMIPFVGIITLPIMIYIVYKNVYNLNKIIAGVDDISGGVYNKPVESIKGDGVFKDLGDNLNQISRGLSAEVERRMKSERLKTELITNISHDIRTPLTSLVAYVDLLQKEETDNENIKNYAQILSQKSGRLKTLTDSLFEAAKAASGNIAACIERVDVCALISQGMGEINDLLTNSNLDFKVILPDEKLYALADGKLLWRVCENLLSNAVKYSLEKTRVYISAKEEGSNVFIEIKNVSAFELNIPGDELTERFVRGDLSRGSEGSGLGLDIARSLMIAQNGDLSITVDGDLFKATVRIPK